MSRRGMWADFTEEDIELMLSIRREAEAREAKSGREVFPAQAEYQGCRPVKTSPDRKIAHHRRKNKAPTESVRSPKD